MKLGKAFNEYLGSVCERIDFRTQARREFESRVASRDTVLDIGGRNHLSRSYRKLRDLSTNPDTNIVSTDLFPDYHPDIVDDICNSKIASESFDAIYCDAILEHVQNYQAAIDHMYRILKPGGEIFIYVPFFWPFHDRTDYHRFSIAELDRILGSFAEKRLFLPDGNGFGGVVWQILTFYRASRFPRCWRVLSAVTNGILGSLLAFVYLFNRSVSFFLQRRGKETGMLQTTDFKTARILLTHFYINHGFCGWARK